MSLSPASAFWAWSLEAYARPGVADALLRLQDQAGLDANILLWCCWTATAFAAPPDIALREAIDVTRRWSNDVIGPIRAARRAAKTLASTLEELPSEPFRERLKALELNAEEIEQRLLERLARGTLAERPPHQDSLLAARRTLLRYADLAGAVGREGFATIDLDALAGAIFPSSGGPQAVG